MKLSLLLLFACCLQVAAKGYAQNVSLSLKNVDLSTALKEIKKQTGFSFIYGKELMDESQKVTIEVKDQPLDKVLSTIFQSQPLEYEISGNFIVLSPKSKKPVEQPLTDLTSATINVHGRIVNEDGKPVAGVSIQVKGNNTKGTTTNANGDFILRGVDENATLVFSGTNIETFEQKLNGKAELGTLAVKDKIVSGEEVVVNKGYYTEKKALSTSDVTTITSKDIEKQSISNPLQALQWQTPGLLITQGSGLPGSSFNIQLRGQNSIGQTNNLFYVIDGVPYPSTLPNGLINGLLYGGNTLNYVNPDDIESITVLKDADALAIYGSRAANGAILITTKKGKAGIVKADINLRSGFSFMAHDMPMMNTQQYLQMRRQAFKNDGVLPGPADHDINGDWDTTRYTNWAKVLLQPHSPYTDANVTLSGGTANTQFLIGGAYQRQADGRTTIYSSGSDDGTVQNISAHFNIINSSRDRRLNLTVTGSYDNNLNTVRPVDFTFTRLQLAPDAPALFNPDGSLNWAPLSPGIPGTWSNPLAGLNARYKQNTSNLVGSMSVSYTIFKGLAVLTTVGYHNLQVDESRISPTTVSDPGNHPASGSSVFQEANSHSWSAEPQLNYDYQFKKSKIGLTVGGSFQESASRSNQLTASTFPSDALLLNPASAVTLKATTTSTQFKADAIYTRLNYTIRDKYVINATGRRDGSSRFGPGKQFGTFASIAGAWLFGRENFFQRALPFVSAGKIRASYGTQGSDGGNDYKFLDLYTATPSANTYQNSTGLAPANLFNNDFAWEITRKLEIGIELGFLKDRINIRGNFYRNRTSNQLVNQVLPQVTGFTFITANLPALVQNQGWDLSFNTTNIKSKNFNWTSTFNISASRNKLVSFPNQANTGYANTLKVGLPLNSGKLFRYAGINPTTGLYQFYTAKGDITYTPDANTDVFWNSFQPGYFGALGNILSYKAFTLDFAFGFIKQRAGKFWSNIASDPPGVALFNQPVAMLDHWQQPGDNNVLFQRYTTGAGPLGSNALTAQGYLSGSDYASGDASFVRLKYVDISWSLPQQWQQKAHLKNARIYIQAQNLLTFTKYEGLDPETLSYAQPPVRVVVFGCQVGL